MTHHFTTALAAMWYSLVPALQNTEIPSACFLLRSRINYDLKISSLLPWLFRNKLIRLIVQI